MSDDNILRDIHVDRSKYSSVILLPSTESTNADAQSLLTSSLEQAREQLGELSLIATDDQRAGRGRMEREWTASAGTALCTSFIVRPHQGEQPLPQESLRWLTMLMALAGRKTLEEYGVKAGIKWPNDLLLDGKKIAGILAQLAIEPSRHISAIVGIGINTNMTAEQLPVETATSLFCQTGQKVDATDLLERLAHHFGLLYSAFSKADGNPEAPLLGGISLLDALRAQTVTLGQEVSIHLPDGGIDQGTAVDFAPDGEIVVRHHDNSLHTYAVGDIVHLRPSQS